MRISRGVATWFGIGLLPKAPGTWGSLAALPFGYGLHVLGGFIALSIAICVVFAIGLWATSVETRNSADHDPSEIVIDEVVGQWIALMPLSIGMSMVEAAPTVFPWPGWVAGFVLFRVFDIWKPWPVSRADQMHTPLGVMLDDVLAGLLAALGGVLLAAIAHLWWMS